MDDRDDEFLEVYDLEDSDTMDNRPSNSRDYKPTDEEEEYLTIEGARRRNTKSYKAYSAIKEGAKTAARRGLEYGKRGASSLAGGARRAGTFARQKFDDARREPSIEELDRELRKEKLILARQRLKQEVRELKQKRRSSFFGGGGSSTPQPGQRFSSGGFRPQNTLSNLGRASGLANFGGGGLSRNNQTTPMTSKPKYRTTFVKRGKFYKKVRRRVGGSSPMKSSPLQGAAPRGGSGFGSGINPNALSQLNSRSGFGGFRSGGLLSMTGMKSGKGKRGFRFF